MKKLKNKELPDNKNRLEKLAFLLHRNGITIFEYFIKEEKMRIYNEHFLVVHEIPDFLRYLDTQNCIHPDDIWKTQEFYKGRIRGPIELRVFTPAGEMKRKILDASLIEDATGQSYLIGCEWDVTEEKAQEEVLETRAKKDAMTGLYNHFAGKELIEQYLAEKDPYATCGMMVLDIDFFKNVNDTYGHLFGDEVLKKLADTLKVFFDRRDIVVRAGGDEFVVLLKGISHSSLLKKAMQLVETVRRIPFEETDYCMTCSVGVCFLPENVSGYSYEELFENADWALYKAKENGRNQYAFCDNLQRFSLAPREFEPVNDVDARYLRNDIISTAFEIFEKTNSFETAIELLLKVIGIRFQLDRITIIMTNIREKSTARQFQWVSDQAPEALTTKSSFEKEDFLTLFQSYDEHGTTVLQYDNMGMYSEGARELLMQGGAKTVLYAAMYNEGQYTGAISYVVCRSKRYWSRHNRKEMGELTKIISAHLTRHLAINSSHQGLIGTPEFDQLTGLISFPKFKEEVERLIVGEYARGCVLVYSDFENFKLFNQKYGYSSGDQVLKEFSTDVANRLSGEDLVYFCRVVADQFIMYLPFTGSAEEAVEAVNTINQDIMRKHMEKYPDINFRIRSGIYFIEDNCQSASAAIDAANYARTQLIGNTKTTAFVYNSSLGEKRQLENDIITGMSLAIERQEFQVYLQPKFSFQDLSIIGAEALVRWKREDGTILYPDKFIPLYEENGRIVELDYYVMEQTIKYMAELKEKGFAEIPISVNISVRHATDADFADNVIAMLQKHNVDPSFLEIELTETETVEDYRNVRRLFAELKHRKIGTSLDDLGAGYSILNTVVDVPVDTIKLDRKFIQRCIANERGEFLLSEIVSMIKGLGYQVVCEGIETKDQADYMREIGGDTGQGYWVSRPIPMEDFTEKYMRTDS